MGLLQTLSGDIAQEVQALEPSPVAEVEAGDWIDRTVLRILGLQEVIGCN
jgi:hypothetical protein